MTFRLISLYMGSPLSRIYAIIYDRVFQRFPRPGVHTTFCPSSFALILMGNRELVALIVLLLSFDC